MYRIKFYDLNETLIATHTITADHLLCSLFDAEKYCMIIAKEHKNVNRWFIFEYGGHLLLSGRLE